MKTKTTTETREAVERIVKFDISWKIFWLVMIVGGTLIDAMLSINGKPALFW